MMPAESAMWGYGGRWTVLFADIPHDAAMRFLALFVDVTLAERRNAAEEDDGAWEWG